MEILVRLCYSLQEALTGKSFAKVVLGTPPVADDFIQLQKTLYRIDVVVHIDSGDGYTPWAIVAGVRPGDMAE